MQHLDTDEQLTIKQGWLLENLLRIGNVQPGQVLPPLSGPHWKYRRKARLGVKEVTKKSKILVGFRERGGRFLADLSRCEILHPPLDDLLESLAKLIGSLSIRKRLPQVEVAVGDEGVALSFRVLTSLSPEDKTKLIAFGQHHDLQIYLQPGGPDTVSLLWPEQAVLSYGLPAQQIKFSFKPHQFIQVNAEINRQLVERVIELLQLTGNETVLDLYCGLGNLSLPIARFAGFVTGVEGDHELVVSARCNAVDNGITNVDFYTADLTADICTQDWINKKHDLIVLDPPRSGAIEILSEIAALEPRKIVYVSCHPATLARDARELVHRFGYELLKAGVMDMFPHTAHVESIALFQR